MKAHAALFTFSAFFLIAGQAAASRPQAAVRISSFTKFEEAVGAVCSAAGQPAAGIFGMAAVRAPLAQIGQFDVSAPWRVAAWTGKCEVMNPETGKPMPIPGVTGLAISLPVSGADLSRLQIQPEMLEEQGVRLIAREKDLLAVVDVAKILQETVGATVTGRQEVDAMIAGADEVFSAPAAHPNALVEFWQDAQIASADPSALSSAMFDNLPDDPAFAGLRKAAEAACAISAARAAETESINGFVDFDPASGFTFVTTTRFKEGSESAAIAAGADALTKESFAGIPASAKFFVSCAPVPGCGPKAAKLVREVVAPAVDSILDGIEKEKIDADDADEKAKFAAVRTAAPAFVAALAALCEAESGRETAFFAVDPSGRAALRARAETTSAAPVSAAFAATRALGEALRAACDDDEDDDNNDDDDNDGDDNGDACSFAVSPADDTSRLEVTMTSADLPGPVVGGAKIADDGRTLELAFGHPAADFSGVQPIAHEPIFALASKFDAGTRPVAAGAISISGIVSDVLNHAAALDIDDDTAAKLRALLDGIPADSRALFAFGAREREVSQAFALPLSAVKLAANAFAVQNDIFAGEQELDFADDELLDIDDDADDADDADD